MKHMHQKGFSLVELMIAILLAAITAVVVLQVLTSYQNRANTMTGRNDAQIGAAMGLYSLEKEIRMGGGGLTTATGPLCAVGANIAWDGAIVTANGGSNGGPLIPVRIIDGGAGPDAIEIVRSNSDFGAAPTRLIAAMGSPTAQLSVDGRAGLQDGDLVMVGASDGAKLCTLMQLTAAPTANGSGWLFTHGAGVGSYNPADPAALFTNAVSYDVRDMVVNLGTYGIRRYGIVCDGGGAPAATNNCDLAWWNPLDLGGTPVLAAPGLTSISPQIVELQAQYGISAAASSDVITGWVDATAASGWDAPTALAAAQIKAVRISLIARGAREGDAVAPAAVMLWDDDDGDGVTDDPRNRNFTTAERRFRYQTLTVVIPLINAIWSGS
jgi:type IV pilus assembly protein PilW